MTNKIFASREGEPRINLHEALDNCRRATLEALPCYVGYRDNPVYSVIPHCACPRCAALREIDAPDQPDECEQPGCKNIVDGVAICDSCYLGQSPDIVRELQRIADDIGCFTTIDRKGTQCSGGVYCKTCQHDADEIRRAAAEIVAARERAERAEADLAHLQKQWKLAIRADVKDVWAKLAKAREGLEWYASSDRSDSRSCYVARATLKEIE